jgi:L-ascorbate metabolism protein UlaG (beta-lactamase superfamily)
MKRKAFIKTVILGGAGALFLPRQISAERKPKTPLFKPEPSEWKSDETNIAWIGHSTMLINLYGTLILTDPVLSDRVGPRLLGSTYGPIRYVYPALSKEEMPRPDVILISHAHFDHMDKRTLKFLTDKYPDKIECITARNTSDIIDDLKWKSLNELDWDSMLTSNDANFYAVEVKHNGWRWPFEMDRQDTIRGRSFNGYLIEKNNFKIFFAGDTAFTDLFRSLKKENVDVAIFPVGGYVPKEQYHCNPEEALMMADKFIGAEYFIPMHCKTFDTDDELEKPLIWLNKIKHDYKIRVVINDIGQTFSSK